MTDTVVEAPAEEQSPAFLQALGEVGETLALKTSRPIFNAQGTKLLEGGVRIDKSLYDRLVSHRLSAPLDECIDGAVGQDGAALRTAAEAALARWPFFGRMAATTSARDALLAAVAAVPLPRPVALHLSVVAEARPALFEHSILAALLCAHLARGSKTEQIEPARAAAAGLLHDLGMLHIDGGLLDSNERLSAEQLKPVYVHPLTTSILVDRFPVYPKAVVRAIVEHHERLDGSGYPRALSGEAISPLGRMLSLAEVVTAMFTAERQHPEQRVALLLRFNRHRYDAALCAQVHRLLAPASEGAGDGIAAGALTARVLQLAEVLVRWRDSREEVGQGLGASHQALLAFVDEQNAVLQRTLYGAGITPEQLAAIGGELETDAALRLDLWVFAEELLWQLHAAANHLRHRWQATEPRQPHPARLAAWLGEVAALDTQPPV